MYLRQPYLQMPEFADIAGLTGSVLGGVSLYHAWQTRRELRYEAPIQVVKSQILDIYTCAQAAATYDGDKALESFREASIKYTALFASCRDKLEIKDLVTEASLQRKLKEFYKNCVNEDLVSKTHTICDSDGTLARMEDSRHNLMNAVDVTAKALWRYKPRK